MREIRPRAAAILLAALLVAAVPLPAQDYPVVDTGQTTCYDTTSRMVPPPAAGDAFHGQDAQYAGHQPSYLDHGDGTVTDLRTGLMWQQTPDLVNKLTFAEAVAAAATFGLAGYDDWRLPTIKELYSLILFTGIDPSGWNGTDTSELTPFIDTDTFDFVYGDTSAGERVIDAQYWSNTEYVSTTMNGDATAFGVNFADGRIKGYPSEPVGPPGNQMTMRSFVRYVRGNPDYGVNELFDNGDETVTDLATGLVWQKSDDGVGRNWEEALACAESLVLAGCDDWRLPDTKELQSIVEYSRSPDTHGTAAIDPILGVTPIVDEGGGTNFPFYWSSTTHANWTTSPGKWGAYVAFGEALGWMQPPGGGTPVLMDVHGAGAQRSDPKTGDPANWPYGNGPQGDVVRIYNHVRAVRGEPIPACEIRLEDAATTLIDFHPTCPAPTFEVVVGLVSELHDDGDFTRATCLGTFAGQGIDTASDPPAGDGYYYLAQGAGACESRGYGDSNAPGADPRDALEAAGPCP